MRMEESQKARKCVGGWRGEGGGGPGAFCGPWWGPGAKPPEAESFFLN